MIINDLILKKKMSKYALSKRSLIPYSTLQDICSGKTPLQKCSAETIYKLASALNVSMDYLVTPFMVKRFSFEVFKSQICHDLKRLGDYDFVAELLKKGIIRDFYDWKWSPECFYLLAMLDYISRLNEIPLCNNYDDLRSLKLKSPLYPSDILILSATLKDESIKEEAFRNSIPEFKRHNIVENEVRNVV